MHPHERPVKCVHGPEWTPIGAAPGTYPRQFIAKTQLELPFDSDTLFLLSRGSLSHGIVRIIEDDHVGAGDKVKVSIEVRYYSQEALSRANVCSLTRGHRENGIGIFVRAQLARVIMEVGSYFSVCRPLTTGTTDGNNNFSSM